MTPSEHIHEVQIRAIPLIGTTLDTCPTCEQSIPSERTAEIAGKIAARDRQRSAELTARLSDQFARERAAERAAAQDALEQAKREGGDALEKLKRETAQNEAAIREDLRQEAESTLQSQLAEAAQTRADSEAVLRGQLADAEHAKTQFAQASAESAAALDSLRAEAAQTETRIRAEGTAEIERLKSEAAQAEGRIRQEITESVSAAAERRVAEAVEAGQQALTAEQAKHEAARQSDQTTLTELRAAFAESSQTAQDALADIHTKLAGAEDGRRILEQQVQALQESRDAAIIQAVQETREALEKATVVAVQAEQAKRFEETQKLSMQLQDVQRQLANKTAQELGEGAEIDLFEELKAAFEDDLITRVSKGVAGPDIIHDIRENGQVCGRIIYDSKNRKDWKTEYATKLHADQIAAKADHAILSTNKFPAGVRQLHQQDGVILACPARVLVVAELLRDLVVQTHRLRMSNEEREEKTSQLYEFIIGERFSQLSGSLDTELVKIEAIDEAEVKQHNAIWEKRGKAVKRMQKSQGDLRFEISRIIGTTSAPNPL
jgi:hypothetical protein